MCCSKKYMGVSENSGTPKSSILIGFSIINPYFWKHPYLYKGNKPWRLPFLRVDFETANRGALTRIPRVT